MPLDGTGYEARIQLLDKMDQVIDLLGDPRRWCKKQLQTADRRYCILGAMKAMDAETELKAPILLAIKQVTGRDYLRIEVFNDRRLTTHADVVKVLQQARQNIVTGMTPTTERSIGPWAQLSQVFR